jgi:stress responsive alpha/beta barrel protein
LKGTLNPPRASLCLVLLATALAGCRSHRRAAPQASEPPQWNLGHVVVFWLKNPGDPEGRRRIIEASNGFRSIPGVLAVQAGEMLPSPLPNVDKSFDVATVIWFKDRAALEAYQTNPKHKAMLAQVGPLVERTTVYDFTRQGLRQGGRGRGP